MSPLRNCHSRSLDLVAFSLEIRGKKFISRAAEPSRNELGRRFCLHPIVYHLFHFFQALRRGFSLTPVGCSLDDDNDFT